MDAIIITPPRGKKPVVVELPSSKSISNRLLILNALSYNARAVKNLSDSDDTKALYTALHSNASLFNVGAAGTTMRFLTAFLSRIVGEWVITGSNRMKERPIAVLVDALRQLGARIEYLEKEGFPPIRIFGSALQGKTLELPGNISSQYISALLMIAPVITNGVTLKLIGDVTSKPYIALTLKLMEQYGVKAQWEENVIHVPEQTMKPPRQVRVEADWSAASYWFQIAALSGLGTKIILRGLDQNSLQGDAKVAGLFEPLGVNHEFVGEDLVVTNIGGGVQHFEYDFTDQPDLAQTFAVTCACMGVSFHFTGLHTLKIKETDRINALIAESRKLGFVFSTNNVDDLKWDGKKDPVTGMPIINTYHDHRMAMAFAPASLYVGEVQIENPSVVTKSYPGFWNDLEKAGFSMIYR
ncbi:3-phosphoshikimate 1-carboxyvinyltransferase [Thermophagus sp. OGC60D27]|uniref:3-phosphoshikimate 1-carboxyvinyltransferase n=1 Tax=Thermophagus sp. OGC60D27 TaxID=3458415 RepID=UPI0040378618